VEARILIVDDERRLVVYLQSVLASEFPGYQVDAAYSGEEALSRLAAGKYDLILADLRMPGFDGLELVRGVRYFEPNVPIILMTGYGSEAVQEEAARLGVSHYLDKPFDVEELFETVGRLLPGRSEGGDA
jgi:CheY-like chemotaxis protein